LTIQYATSASSQGLKEVAIESPFMKWFTADGYFVALPFQQWLATSVPLIAEADPNNAIASKDQAIRQMTAATTSNVTSASNGATFSSKETPSKRRKG
jgi:hypothetical protein